MQLCLAACWSLKECYHGLLMRHRKIYMFNGTFAELQNFVLIICKEILNPSQGLQLLLPNFPESFSCNSSHDICKPRKENKEIGEGKVGIL